MSNKQNDLFYENLHQEIVDSNLKRKKLTGLGEIDASFNKCLGYKCVECGKEVSPATVRFFNYQVDLLKCYDCQYK